ncbi:hypothetical protein C8Q75DRAFT_713864, partial [Abortiporus biennis]
MQRDVNKKSPKEAGEGWKNASEILRKYDDKKIKSCKEDIDTLLVITGLFTGVLTTFILDRFGSLQESTDDQMLAMLTQISHQLSSFVITGSYTNSTIPFISNPPSAFQKSPLDIRVNILWFTSLMLSLVTGFLGLLVKQWFWEYLLYDSLSPRSYVRTRYYRHIGLETYRVFGIASFLPVLLQISIVLFLIGLSDFTSIVDSGIGKVVSALVFSWLTIYFIATIAPILSAQNPWKTP